MATSPVTVTVFDGDFVRRGAIGAPLEIEATPRHMALPTAKLVVEDDHPRAVDLTAPGARVVLTYAGEHLLSGPVTTCSWDTTSRAFVAELADDWGVLGSVLGWPVPGAGLGAQSAPYDVRTGPAETVVKGLVAANAARLGLPLTVAPDLGRGATITVSSRFHPLTDRLLPVVDQAGIGITVRQAPDGDEPGLVLDCYAPAVYPRTLTDESAVIVQGAVVKTRPTVTRVVAGSQGEAENRAFYTLVDAAREAEWGCVIEVFIDVRDTTDVDEITQRMQERLDEGAARSGLSLELSETDTFRYGRTVRVGDRVSARVGPGLIVDDVLREARLTLTATDGLQVVPVIGERTDDPGAAIGRAIGGIAKAIRALRTT